MGPVGILDRLGDDIAAAGVLGHWVTPDEIGKMPDFGGAYVLVLRLDKAIHIEFPRVASHQLMPGWYLYAGSARGSGGIRARVKRHFRYEKTAHWHIDRLTVHAVEMAALAVADGHECELVSKLLESLQFKVAAAGFGSTDCSLCKSHLLTTSEHRKLGRGGRRQICQALQFAPKIAISGALSFTNRNHCPSLEAAGFLI
jgi:Uri superfamily endonuclease